MGVSRIRGRVGGLIMVALVLVYGCGGSTVTSSSPAADASVDGPTSEAGEDAATSDVTAPDAAGVLDASDQDVFDAAPVICDGVTCPPTFKCCTGTADHEIVGRCAPAFEC
jgi:hypothetical protein